MINTDKLENGDKLLITIEEVAALTGIGRTTAYKLAKKIDFPCVIIGNKKMAIKSQLDKWFVKHMGEAL